MSIQIFGPRSADGSVVRIPKEYRRRARWLPQLGDMVPDFQVDTTQGPLRFWEWAEGSWVYLFSHPAAFTSVCTTEVGSLAMHQPDFENLGAKVLGLTSSSVPELLQWHDDIEALYDVDVFFPTAFDAGGQLASLFGMHHAKQHPVWPIRKSFIIDPALRLAMVLEYPIFAGRNAEEIIRVMEAAKTYSETGAYTPADWIGGDPVLVPAEMSDKDALMTFGQTPSQVLPYMRYVPQTEYDFLFEDIRKNGQEAC